VFPKTILWKVQDYKQHSLFAELVLEAYTIRRSQKQGKTADNK